MPSSREPQVRAVASQLSSIAKEYGFVKIHSFPDLDSLTAASLLAEALRRQNVDFEVEVTANPPTDIAEPAVLLGYGPDLLEYTVFKARSILIYSGKPVEGLQKIPVLADEKSSVAGLTATVLTEVVVATDIYPLALAAAYWRGMDSGRRGEFMGFESSLAELLSMGGEVEGSLTLRLFRWFEEPVETALEITVDPFIPGLTGRRDAVEKLLSSDPRLSRLKGVSIRDAGEEQVTALATTLYDTLKRVSRVVRRPSEVVGYSYYAPRLPVRDLREVAYLLAFLGEREAAYVAAVALSPLQVLGYASYRYYTRGFEEIVENLEKLYSAGRIEARRIGRLRVAVVENVEYVLPVERQARLLGVTPSDAALAVKDSEGLRVSLETLHRLLGFRDLIDQVKAGCIEPIAGTLLGIIREHRCA